MPNYDYHCEECESINVENHPMTSRPETSVCACGGKSHYKISAPNLMIKEAFLDGTKRKGWAEMREASKLNKEMVTQKNTADRKKIEKQIKQMGVQIRKD